MTEQEQKNAASNFSAQWNGHGDEKSDTQNFWTTLLKEILGVEKPFDFIKFNRPVKFKSKINNKNHTGEFDAIIESTKVLIEQKDYSVRNLDLKYPQSDGAFLTPFEQAKRYAEGYNSAHKYSEYIKWIVVCNFSTFRIYDVRPQNALFFLMYPEFQFVKEFHILELYNNVEYLNFLIDPDDDTVRFEAVISKEASDIVSEIYNILEPDYLKTSKEFLKKLCTRLVFLFYANDAALIDNDRLKKYFKNHKYSAETLQNLFVILNKKENLRDDNISDELKNFPYVNGGLFEENIFIPEFDLKADLRIRNAIEKIHKISDTKKFAWRYIDPPIFGALFEGILNDKTRRAGGMHYTSTDNIHKVIDPLFLDDLRAELESAKNARIVNRQRLLRDLHKKLTDYIFFDPACGSGNFLTETYLSLRKIENEIIDLLHRGSKSDLFDENSIKVSINQFYGIEINSYACHVAQVALWISENQMFQATKAILGFESDGLPLNHYDQIFNENALQTDWNEILPKDKLAGKKVFIIGNPPFVGYTYQTPQQKQDLLDATDLNFKKIDYVTAWYFKAADFIQGTDIHCAFVSTNSITQGEQVAVVWKPLFKKIHFDFVYRTFKWTSDSEKMAAVHCVIIGFSAKKNRKTKLIFDGKEIIKAKNINAYLIDGANVFVESRTKPLCNVPEMNKGSQPTDKGNLIIEADKYDEFIKNEPRAKKYIRPLLGSEEFIHGKKRYCLWLVNCTDEEIAEMPLVAARVEKVKKFRLASKKEQTRKDAAKPMIFTEIRQPQTNYIAVPETSSENRHYVPMNFLDKNFVVTNSMQVIPNAGLYEFGVLNSSIHNAWVRAVCGRLEMRYRYSAQIVYNNFVWCSPTVEQRAEIERTAQKILDTRADFAGKTLAYLYDEKTMPEKLRAAHRENDLAVMAAYGFSETLTEAEIVAALMEMYRELTI